MPAAVGFGSLEAALRAIIRDEVQELRSVVREEVAALLREQQSAGAAPVYLTITEAATVAAVEPATVRNWISRGDLRRHRAGRHLLRVRLDELVAYLHCDPEADASTEIEARAEEILRSITSCQIVER